MPKKQAANLLAQNKKAFVTLEILEKIEAGIELSGPEVKSIRASQANLKGSHIEITEKGEAFARNIHISPYKQATGQQKEYDPTRKRKLLLHKSQINQLAAKLEEKGVTLVPLDFHLTNNRIKLTIGVGRGKKKHDRRSDLKKRDQDVEIRRTLKKFDR